MGAPAIEQEREFQFSDADFEHLQRLVSIHTGIALSEAKRDLVYGRLARRLRELQLNRFDEYCRLLDQGDDLELENFVNAITTNLTSFFREPHHFDYLANTVLPGLATARPNRRLRIWSAGCSTGEESYSIAISVKESVLPLDAWDIRILATDLDTNVVEKGREGIYRLDRIADLSRQRTRHWFHRGLGKHDGQIRVADELRHMITFKPLNLMGEWPIRGPFDVIFCRNVVIYFDKKTQKRLFDRFAEILSPDGYLFIGHSESLFKVTDRFELIGNTTYRKRF